MIRHSQDFIKKVKDMNILVINGSCLSVNSSANLCHLAYLQGLIDAGAHVSLLSASPVGYFTDVSMTIPAEIECHYVKAISLYERLSYMKRRLRHNSEGVVVNPATTTQETPSILLKIKEGIRSLYGPHGIEHVFYCKSKKFTSGSVFDFVISISHPPVSHLTAYKLLKSNHIKASHWIQIWEDPWYSDAYGFNGKADIFNEEKRLLSFAEKVCYVSPLTLRNQQRLFPESAEKMFWMPLPAYYKNAAPVHKSSGRNIYGYFGDYAPAARDLEPFYAAAYKARVEVNVCGNPSNLFHSTDKIHIHPRLPLAELKPIEDGTNVLVFLCNRQGGQIPGKIYQYSATDKTILFILDGTEDEQAVLKDYFGKFNRYVFCRNTVEDITRAIRQIESGDIGSVRNVPLDDFEPSKIITNILKMGNDSL